MSFRGYFFGVCLIFLLVVVARPVQALEATASGTIVTSEPQDLVSNSLQVMSNLVNQVTDVLLSLFPQEDALGDEAGDKSPSEASASANLMEASSSAEVVQPTPNPDVIPDDGVIRNVDLSQMKPIIFNASFYEGNKKVYGKMLLPDIDRKYVYAVIPESLPQFEVQIYFSEANQATQGEYIGSTELFVSPQGEAVFLLDTPSRAGGWITALVRNKATGESSSLAQPLENSTFTVDSTGDEADAALNGVCLTAGGTCTLRAAIAEANSVSGADVISFAIPTSSAGYRDVNAPDTTSSGDSADGDDYWTIRTSSSLPQITGPVTINGASQEQSADRNTLGPDIEVRPATSPSTSQRGLELSTAATNTTINKLAISGYNQTGYAGIFSAAANLTVTNSYIGTDVTGSVAKQNVVGIRLRTNAGVSIGTSTSDGNIIAGNQGKGLQLDGASSNNSCTTDQSTTSYIRGNKFALNRAGTAVLANAGVSLELVGNLCDTYIGGPDAAHRNYIIPTSGGEGIKSASFETVLGDIYILNNFFASDVTGTVMLGASQQPFEITTSSTYTGGTDHGLLQIGDEGAGNFINGLPVRLENLKAVEVAYNTFANNVDFSNYGYFLVLYNNRTNITNGVYTVKNNYFGASEADPYFGLETTGNYIDVVAQGSVSLQAFGNYFSGNYASMQLKSYYSDFFTRTTFPATNLVPYSNNIGGTDSYEGSLCNGKKMNCFDNQQAFAIMFHDYLPSENLETIYDQNVFTNTSTDTLETPIVLTWNAFFELFSGTTRRTDLSVDALSFSLPSGRYSYGYTTTYAYMNTLTNKETTCTTAGDCPATGHSTGEAGNTAILDGGSGSVFWAGGSTWIKVVGKYINSAGTLVDTSNWKFDANHIASTTFSFDGDSTTHPIESGAERTISSKTYYDLGEPWTNNPTADASDNNTLGLFQLMETQLVDANPVLQSDGSYVIEVDSLTFEDNVSSAQFNDEGGAASGGGLSGDDGLANGATSLFEAVTIAKKFTSPVTIRFGSDVSGTWQPAQTIEITGDGNQDVDVLAGSGVTIDGSLLGDGEPCMLVSGSISSLVIKDFTFVNCENGAIKITGGSRINAIQNSFRSTDESITPVNLIGGTEDSYGNSANDEQDLDTGPNDLINTPVITAVDDMGNGEIVVRGTQALVTSNSPYTVRVCISTHLRNIGDCLEHTATATVQSDGRWEASFEVEYKLGYQIYTVSAAVVDTLGNSSEYTVTRESREYQYGFSQNYPVQGQEVSSKDLFLDWDDSTDPELYAYRVYLGSTLEDLKQVQELVPAQSETRIEAIGEGTYYWQVVAYKKPTEHEQNTGEWRVSGRTGVEKTVVTAVPTLSTQFDGIFPNAQIFTQSHIPFIWHTHPDASGYKIVVRKRSELESSKFWSTLFFLFRQQRFTLATVSGNLQYSYIWKGDPSLTPGTYDWQVIALADNNAQKEIKFSAIRSFTLGRPLTRISAPGVVQTADTEKGPSASPTPTPTPTGLTPTISLENPSGIVPPAQEEGEVPESKTWWQRLLWFL